MVLYDAVRVCVVFPCSLALILVQKGQRVKKYSEYNVWRNKAFPLFQRVTQLIGGNQAVGDNAFSSQKGSAAAPSTSAPSASGPPAATAPAYPPVSTTPTHSEDGDNLYSTQASGAPRSISSMQVNSAPDHGAVDDSDTAPATQDVSICFVLFWSLSIIMCT